MKNIHANIVAFSLLAAVFFLCVFSMAGDSLTMDEKAHIPAGYSYLAKQDMRLNPEHPPLIKDLAAFPLLFIKGINFPSDIKDWNEEVNGQWGFGYNFFFNSGNPADKMIFWARIPMVMVLLLLGFYVFKWARELFGNIAGLIALFLFCFSPTFLAHGRLVTTDVGASFGIFIALYYFLKALKEPKTKNIVFSGIAFGIAQLLKFSAVVLGPFFIFLAFIWALSNKEKIKETAKVLILTFFLGALTIFPVYQFHVLNYPTEKQAADITFIMASHPIPWLGSLMARLSKVPVIRAYVQYFLGLFMVMQRAAGGNTTYFLGEVSATGWKIYFPLVYLIKETIVFHFLTLVALVSSFFSLNKSFFKVPFKKVFDWIKQNFPQFAMFCFIGLYWLSSLTSNLNIGVRHLLPTFPFVMMLTASMISTIIEGPSKKIKYLVLFLLFCFQAYSVLSVYPHFLSYFNELIGGPKEGYIYTVDSNLDWGQDLKRLEKWVDANNIDKIYIDYFGGADAEYYFKEKFEPWSGQNPSSDLPRKSFLAVSMTFFQGGRGKPSLGFNQPAGFYRWLDLYEPVAIIGNSIIVFYID